MTNMHLKKWMIAATLFLAFGGYAQNTKLVLIKGQKYEVTTTSKVNSVASVMGQEMENIANTTTVETFEVKNTDAAQTDLVSMVTRMVINATAMGQETSFDSDKKDNSGPGTEEMAKLINKPKNIVIDANGKILKEDKDEASDANMAMSGAKSAISFFNASMIGKTVKMGESWMDSIASNTDKIKTNTVGTYSVKGIENNIATIVFNGTTTVAGVMEQMGQEMDMKSTSKVTGESKLDLTNGIIIETTTSSDGNMTIEVSGMSIPVTVKITSTTKTKAL